MKPQLREVFRAEPPMKTYSAKGPYHCAGTLEQDDRPSSIFKKSTHFIVSRPEFVAEESNVLERRLLSEERM